MSPQARTRSVSLHPVPLLQNLELMWPNTFGPHCSCLPLHPTWERCARIQSARARSIARRADCTYDLWVGGHSCIWLNMCHSLYHFLHWMRRMDKAQRAKNNDPRSWRPKGVLVTSLHEHKASVNQLAVARDNLFMASGTQAHSLQRFMIRTCHTDSFIDYRVR